MKTITSALNIDPNDPKTKAILEMHKENHDLITNLANIRKKRGLSQKDIATKLNITQTTISRLEQGLHEPKRSLLIRYAEAVDAVISFKVTRLEDIENQ